MTVVILRQIGTARIVKLDDGWTPITFEVRDAEGNHRGTFRNIKEAKAKALRVGHGPGEYYRDAFGRVCEGGY
jgi:hypothetical protein